MSQTRYCSTCGTLLSQGAAICGECGARYQASPYERRATDAPGAWSQAPRARSRDLGPAQEESAAQEGIELISAEELQPRAPGSTALRAREQYDQVMVTQPPPGRPGPGAPAGHPGAPGHPAAAGQAGLSDRGAETHPELEPPLDGCVPASPLKRFLAALIDAVIASLTTLPLLIGLILIITQESATLLAQILVGLGAAIPAAYTVLIIWLVGAKGFSLGKLIMGLRVTRFREAGSIGVLRSLGRWILYAAVWVVMALSIFLDPRKHLRGFHDRAVDSVVVDVKAGRHPLLPRPDDFERASADHYLGAPSVPVTAHENLLAEPGAAWRGDGQPEPAASQAPATGWAPQASSPSPYAPPPSPMAQDSSAPPPMIGSPWSPPPAPHAADAHSGTDSWAPPQEPWDAPAPPPGPPQPPPDHPGAQHAPPQQPPPQQPVFPQPGPEPSAPQQSWASQAPAPQMPPAEPGHSSVPSELTTDAWDEDEVDEETRMVVPDGGDLGDLEQTRVSALPGPPVPTLRLVADDGTERTVQKPVVIGRNPSATDDQVLFVFQDDTRSVSKTHLQIDGTGQDVTVTDLGSTNGSAILREDGSRESLVPNTPTVLPAGATLAIGDRTLTMERTQ